MVFSFLFLQILLNILYANGEDLDQTPHNAVSDLGQHYLLKSKKMDACLWVRHVYLQNSFQQSHVLYYCLASFLV